MEEIIDEDDFLLSLVRGNFKDYNIDKAIEECVEFLEILIKTKTKVLAKKPDKMALIDEFGDLMYRGMVAIQDVIFSDEDDFSKLDEAINARIAKKLKELYNYRLQHPNSMRV